MTPDDSARNRKMRKMMSLNCSICSMPVFGVGKDIEFGLRKGPPPSTVARDAPPSVSVAPSGFLVFCRLCSVCPFLFAVGPLVLFCLGDLIGDVGLASSHGLDRTAANYTGADQLSSLPCRPERPRAAKSAHMVRSVGFVCIAKITLLIVPYISACCCDLLLTAWTV